MYRTGVHEAGGLGFSTTCYRRELHELEEMGFANLAANLVALEESARNVEVALHRLLS